LTAISVWRSRCNKVSTKHLTENPARAREPRVRTHAN
jgi:hypothetical protein